MRWLKPLPDKMESAGQVLRDSHQPDLAAHLDQIRTHAKTIAPPELQRLLDMYPNTLAPQELQLSTMHHPCERQWAATGSSERAIGPL